MELRASLVASAAPAGPYEYDALDPDVAAIVREAAAIIRAEGRRTLELIIRIGEQMARTKAALGHGLP